MSWENEMLYLCNVIQKEKSHTDLKDLTDLLRCKQRFSLCLTGKNSEGVKIREIRVGKTKTPRGENFVRFERFVFKNQALRSAHLTLTINHLNT